MTSPEPTYSGKVRDVYDAGAGRLLFVASDRISAFDVVMAEPIPDKGRVLTAMTAFWLEQLTDVLPNHLVSLDVPAGVDVADRDAELRVVEGRALEADAVVGEGFEKRYHRLAIGGI